MNLIESIRRARIEVAIERAKLKFAEDLNKYAARYLRNQSIIDRMKEGNFPDAD